ncbi:MAG: winged helix-turn-helix domain-containing protein [Candidatus Nanopelagicales bacterium]
MTKILLIEDEDSIRESVSYLLQKEGFEVIEENDGLKGVEKFEKESADLLLLDLMLPGLDGLEICKRIRKTSQVPIIMLTAKDTELDKVLGLELGADDYITKPFSSRELIARVKAILRRFSEPVENPEVVETKEIKIDPIKHKVFVRGEEIKLPLKEFDLLHYLSQNPGRVLTREQIIDRIWGHDYFGDTKTLDVHIKRIRSKIEKNPNDPKIIETIRGLGYKFEQ